MPEHICTCGDCAVADFEDRCKYERALRALVDALHATDPDAALMPQVYDACKVLDV